MFDPKIIIICAALLLFIVILTACLRLAAYLDRKWFQETHPGWDDEPRQTVREMEKNYKNNLDSGSPASARAGLSGTTT